MTLQRHPEYRSGLYPCRKCSLNQEIPKPPKPPPKPKRVLFTATHENTARPLPPAPTASPPGSPQKIETMRARFAAGLHVHHPGDARPNTLSRFRAWLEALAEVNAEVAARLESFSPKTGSDDDTEIDD